MKFEKTLLSILFFLFLAFLFPEFTAAIANANYTGTLAPLINQLPTIFLLGGGILPFVMYGLEERDPHG